MRLRLLRGNPGKRPLRPEPQPARPAQCPEPPPFVTGYAADEWRRVAPELHRLELLTVIDIAALAAYCMAYARWRTAEEVLARLAQCDGEKHVRRISRGAAADMVRFVREFGMTPIERSRLGAIGGQPKSKFDGLIA